MVEAFSGDLLEPIKENGIKGDILISNPPYVSLKEYEELEIWEINEPYDALVGGFDGLDFYRKIVKDAPKYLKNKGYLCLEIGYDQKEDVINILEFEKKFTKIICKKDLFGNDRVIVAKLEEK